MDTIRELIACYRTHDRDSRILGNVPAGEACDALEALLNQRDNLRLEVKNLLASAYPHPDHHPTMFAAWRRAETFLAHLDAKHRPECLCLISDCGEPCDCGAIPDHLNQ